MMAMKIITIANNETGGIYARVNNKHSVIHVYENLTPSSVKRVRDLLNRRTNERPFVFVQDNGRLEISQDFYLPEAAQS